MSYFIPICKYQRRIVDMVPYDSTNVPMYSSDCVYTGDLDVDKCNEGCPAFEKAEEENEVDYPYPGDENGEDARD